MGQYSELIGSFYRTGDFPLEANYIFDSEAALKEFYSQPENIVTTHKGLLRVVANPVTGEQSLWWAVKKKTNDELEFKKLMTYNDVGGLDDQLKKLEDLINQEISDRKTADDAIWGSEDHTSIPADLNSLKDLAEEITNLRESLSIKEELDRTQASVGLDEDGNFVPDKESVYLKDSTSVMDALHTLDRVAHHAIHFNWVKTKETPSMNLDINRQITGTTVSGNVKISTSDGNGITVKNDGLFYKLASAYDDGVLTLRVNDNIIGQHILKTGTAELNWIDVGSDEEAVS